MTSFINKETVSGYFIKVLLISPSVKTPASFPEPFTIIAIPSLNFEIVSITLVNVSFS